MDSILINSEEISTNLNDAVAYKVRYHSYDLHGKPTESTGLVIAPKGAGDNRKVMSWAHGTTGMGDASCPSSQPDPARELVTYFQSESPTQFDYGVPGLQKFIDHGYIVTATDYQGIGTPGVHQYTVNRTNAIDTVRIVHAAREMNVGAGTKFGVMGWSQGGAAAAAVAELDAKDFGELELVGSVPMSPGVPAMAMKMPTGLGASLSGDAIPPDGHLFMILAAMVAAFPDTLKLADVFTPVGIEIYEKNWNIQPVHHLTDIMVRANLHQGAVMKVNKAALPDWMAAMTEASAGRVKPMCPVYVMIDSQHDGTVVPVSWQTEYIATAQALGGDVTSQDCPNDDHFSLPQSCVDEARTWLTKQFGN